MRVAEIGKRLGRTELQQVACVTKPDTILACYRRLIARQFDGYNPAPHLGGWLLSRGIYFRAGAEPRSSTLST
ncbi:MAG: Integrase, catalytic region [Bryobacterales bacterium]|nr:Integrase, catalytic region [Bryobacterales bacterium]